MPDVKSTAVHLLFRIDIGFSEDRGYAAVLMDVLGNRQKGIRGNSIEQLTSRVRNVLIEEMHKRRNFPLESEGAGRTIIVPEDGDPLFNGGGL